MNRACSLDPCHQGQAAQPPTAGYRRRGTRACDCGAQELIRIGQDTTDYGRDLGNADGLPGPLQAILDGAPDLKWLRLMYAYPGHVSPRLIEVMSADSRVCHYLDIPLQHGHPDVLRRMLRPSNTAKLLETIAEMRVAMPDMAFRSTFIVGYPGETEAEFAGLLSFVEQIQFDKVGVFTFSREPGTPAYALAGQVSETAKSERYGRLMEAQQRISLIRNLSQVGRTLEVLVEGHGELTNRRGPVSLAGAIVMLLMWMARFSSQERGRSASWSAPASPEPWSTIWWEKCLSTACPCTA